MSFLNQVKELAFSVDIRTNQRQKVLTREYILPHINRFLSDIETMRKKFDYHFLLNHKKHGSQQIHGVKSMEKYPLGYCEDIRNGLFSLLEQHPFILNARKQGVVFKKVYIILNNSYFQNGMQLGDLWIDVANDTVNPKEERIYYKPIDVLKYQNLTDYDSYCSIIEKYLNIKVFPNTLFPKIAPRFPIFALDTEGVCHILNHQEIILYKDITEQFALSDQFLNGVFSTRQLPKIYQEMILKWMQDTYKEQYPVKELLSVATDKQADFVHQQLSETLFENAIKHDTMSFFFQFQMARLCPSQTIVNQLRQQGEITPKYTAPLVLDNADISFETRETSIKTWFLEGEKISQNDRFQIVLTKQLPQNILDTVDFRTDFSLKPDKEYSDTLATKVASKLRNYPIFRYFHSKRIWQNTEELADVKYLPPQMATYEGSFHALSRFEKFAKWFKDKEDNENRVKIRTKNINYEDPQLETVRQAINTFLSHFKDLKMDNNRVDDSKTIYNDINDLCLDKNGVKHNLNQLSSGEQTIILIVSDIAHHLSIANPNLVNKNKGKGIVLIDEIDIHLHPSWQRDIISAFKATFPNIQFFMTSHSPFIVSSTHKSQLYVLQNENGQSKFKTVSFNPYGKTANQILIDFFQLEGTRTRKVDNELKSLRQMVKNGEYETDAL
jgi:predicted ATP-binding protein involved in virulence